jgi:hypothetical protein
MVFFFLVQIFFYIQMSPDLQQGQVAAKRVRVILSTKNEAAALYTQGKYKEALDKYQQVLTLAPSVDTRAKLHFNTALCLLALNGASSIPPKEVLVALKAALADNPKYFKVDTCIHTYIHI